MPIRALLVIITVLTASSAGEASVLNGTFANPLRWSNDQIDSFMTEAQLLGMDTVIITSTRHMTGDCDDNTYAEDGPLAQVGKVLNSAMSRSISVYVGLVGTQGTCPFDFYLEPQATNTVGATVTAAASIASAYGGHPAFAGWYIPDEPALGAWSYPQLTYSYYQRLVSGIKSVLSKPVLIAPYLVGAEQNGGPAGVAQRAADFKTATGVDIQVWQDSVGKGEIAAGGTRLAEYFAALSGAIGPGSLWADIELFNCCIPGTDLDGGDYYPASIIRINRQLYMTGPPYTTKRVSWIKEHHMSRVDPSKMDGADRLTDAFEALYVPGGGSYVLPERYWWQTGGPPPLPSAAYPDSGNELFDAVTANPNSPLDPAWSGVVGNAAIVLDFGRERSFDWIAIHVLGHPWGITFPAQLTLSGANPGQGWHILASRTLPVGQGHGEYVFSNAAPLGVSFRYAKIELANPQNSWTFVGEVEVIDKP